MPIITCNDTFRGEGTTGWLICYLQDPSAYFFIANVVNHDNSRLRENIMHFLVRIFPFPVGNIRSVFATFRLSGSRKRIRVRVRLRKRLHCRTIERARLCANGASARGVDPGNARLQPGTECLPLAQSHAGAWRSHGIEPFEALRRRPLTCRFIVFACMIFVYSSIFCAIAASHT